MTEYTDGRRNPTPDLDAMPSLPFEQANDVHGIIALAHKIRTALICAGLLVAAVAIVIVGWQLWN
jgi:hypothetical protein